MKIFDIEEGRIVLRASSLAIPEFKIIWNRDKSKDKERAYNELSYITFLCDSSIENPYRNYTEEDRDKVLKEDFFGKEDYEVDVLVLEAIDKYKILQETVAVRLWKASKNAADKMAKYFDNVNFEEVDKFGKPIYSARDLASNLKEIGNIVKSLGTLEKIVKEEQLGSDKIRGGSDIGDYEQKDSNFNYGQ